MRGRHTKTVSSDLRFTLTETPKQKSRLNHHSVSLMTPFDQQDQEQVVESVRDQLKGIVTKVLEFSKGSVRTPKSKSYLVEDLIDTCSRLEANLESVLKEQKEADLEADSPSIMEALTIAEEKIFASLKPSSAFLKQKSALANMFTNLRSQLSRNSSPTSVTDTFKLAQVQESLSAEKESNAELTSLNEDMLKELAESTETNSKLMQMVAKLQSEKVETHRKILGLKSANQSLKALLRSAADPSQTNIETLQTENAHLKERLEALNRDTEQAKAEMMKTIKDLKKKITSLEDSLSELPVIKRSLTNEQLTVKSLHEQLAQVQSEVTDLKEIRSKSTLDPFLKSENTRLQQEVSDLLHEKQVSETGFKQSQEKAEASLRTWQSRVEELTNQLKDQRLSTLPSPKSQQDLEPVVLHLQRQCSELQKQMTALTSEHQETLEANSQLQAEKTRLLSSAKEHVRLASSKSLREGRHDTIQALEAKLTELEDELEEVTIERDELKSTSFIDTSDELYRLEEENLKLKLENQELASLIKGVQNRTFETEALDVKTMEEAKHQIVVLTQRVISAQVSNEMMKRKLSSETGRVSCEQTPTGRDRGDMFRSVSEMAVGRELDGLREGMKIKETLKAKEEEVASLTEKLAQVQAAAATDRSEFELKLDSLSKENSAFQISYEELEEFCTTTEKRYLTQIENDKMELETKSALFREQTTANVKKISELKKEAIIDKAEISRLTEELKNLVENSKVPELRSHLSYKETVGNLTICSRLSYQDDVWWLVTSRTNYVWVRSEGIRPTDPTRFAEALEAEHTKVTLYGLLPVQPAGSLLPAIERHLAIGRY